MRITVLCENTIGQQRRRISLAEWGLSLLIQWQGKTILFDAGHTDIFRRNALSLGILLENVDTIVLSHHHWDHVGGLRTHPFGDKKPLITHPQTIEKYAMDEKIDWISEFQLMLSSDPVEFVGDTFFLGQIQRSTPFEPGCYKNDDMLEDSAIALKTEKGTVVITGCSHAGICNICEQAKKVTGQVLFAVIGGFHLSEKEPEIVQQTLDYFRREKPDILLPMHCVDFPTLCLFHTLFGSLKYGSGDIIKLEI